MVLVLGEQNCNSHGAFRANVNIEDALWKPKEIQYLGSWEAPHESKCMPKPLFLKSLRDCQDPKKFEFPGKSNQAKSGNSNLLVILVYFVDFGVLGSL